MKSLRAKLNSGGGGTSRSALVVSPTGFSPSATGMRSPAAGQISTVWKQLAGTLNNSLDEEGLFREEGDFNEVDRVLKTLRQEQPIDLTRYPIHVITSALKRDIRERTKPLFPMKYYKQVVASHASGKTQTARVAALKSVLVRFPPQHLEELRFLFDLLNRVSQHSAENRMTSENLAKVFAPTVMRAHDPVTEHSNLPYQVEVIRLLIEKPKLISQAINEARNGVDASMEDVQIGSDGREILRMVLGGDVLQFSEGNWRRETGRGMVLSEEQLMRDNLVLEAENQLLALENEELLAMLAASRCNEAKVEAKVLKGRDRR